jgi:NAD(P)H-nitrite reductase large subunit
VQLQAIDDVGGHKRLRFQDSSELEADLVIMATGIRTNLDWLASSGVEVNRGVLVDDHLRSNIPNVYAAGDVAEGRDCVTGERAIHAIEPTAMEHGRIVGANMAGQALAYRGSLLMNIVDVADLEIASFGVWDSASAEVSSALKPDRPAYRKLLWQGDRLIGAIILGVSTDIWTTNDVGMLKGLVQTGAGLGPWKDYLRRNPFDIKKAFLASRTTAQLLPQTILARPSIPAGRVSA